MDIYIEICVSEILYSIDLAKFYLFFQTLSVLSFNSPLFFSSSNILISTSTQKV